MKILIVSATQNELQPILSKYKFRKQNKNGLNVLNFSNRKNSFDLLITGIGIQNTLFNLTRLLSLQKYTQAINAGIAGSFLFVKEHGKLFQVTKDIFCDFCIELPTKIIPMYETHLPVPKNEIITIPVPGFKFPDKKINFDHLEKLTAVTTITLGSVIERKHKIKMCFRPALESMEGAAFFYVCRKFKLPCIQIRSVSNYVGEQDRKKWALDLAIKNLNNELEKLIG
ncbi:MAG: hypothetical protein A3H98_11685 [Bacteroidetes bacterium RIFCSPLOWO2_02_FULL_36_8]|nr:MAG: hypothetical protein A3H98_11685 [Bacteroidetes bacterium RIFCSPLOWO2_02_FULL_36_8]OFY71537.1 MAG: hypothetical protein A3G23_04640 [Bacteroidetes bacterium RIFCSPLOWO2_12_FULL_37_12]